MSMDIIDDSTLQKVIEVNSSSQNSLEKIQEWLINNFIDNDDDTLNIYYLLK